jgi:hypothetical protein
MKCDCTACHSSIAGNLCTMAFKGANSCLRLTRGIGGEGGGTSRLNVPRRRVEVSRTSSYLPLLERVRTICHEVAHAIRKVSNDMRKMSEYIKN